MKKVKKVVAILKLNQKSNKKSLFIFFILGFFTEIINIMNVFLPAMFVQFLIDNKSKKFIAILLISMAILISISSFIVSILKLKITRDSKYLDNKMYCLLNKKAANLDYTKCLNEDVENLYFNAFDNIYHWQDIPILLLNYVLNKSITFVIMFIVFWRINFWLILFVVVTIIIDYVISKKEQKIKKKLNDELSQYTYKGKYLLDCLENYKIGKEIRIFDAKELLIKKYKEVSFNILKIEKRINKNNLLFSTTSKIIDVIRLFIIYLFAILKFREGNLFLSEFLIYISAITQMSNSFDDIIDCIFMINNALYYFDDFEKYLSIPNEFRHPLNLNSKKSENTPLIEFDNVSFKYPNSKEYAIKNISFKIFKNQITSIVGDNGSGKSTLIKLLLRLYDPNQGNIYFNGQNIKNFDYDYYQSLFSVTFQDYKMFCYSIKENIMFDKNIDNKKLEKVLNCLNLNDLIAEVGIHTNYTKRFDENGVEFSGGEEQKLAIARALYKDSKIFIFDEPTATIDPLAEYDLFKNIYELSKQDKTIIFISHRMGSTFYSDKTLVLDKGKIVENDNYKNLMKRKGLYKKMYESQAKYYK